MQMCVFGNMLEEEEAEDVGDDDDDDRERGARHELCLKSLNFHIT